MLRVLIAVFISLLVAFSVGFVVGSIMLQRSLARYLMAAVEKSRRGVHNGEPKHMVEAAGVQELALTIARDFLRSK